MTSSGQLSPDRATAKYSDKRCLVASAKRCHTQLNVTPTDVQRRVMRDASGADPVEETAVDAASPVEPCSVHGAQTPGSGGKRNDKWRCSANRAIRFSSSSPSISLFSELFNGSFEWGCSRERLMMILEKSPTKGRADPARLPPLQLHRGRVHTRCARPACLCGRQ